MQRLVYLIGLAESQGMEVLLRTDPARGFFLHVYKKKGARPESAFLDYNASLYTLINSAVNALGGNNEF